MLLIQAKFHHAVKADATKYSQLWQLQQEEASALVRQMLAADRWGLATGVDVAK